MFYISDDEQPQRRTKHQRLESMVKPTVSTQDISEHASHLGEGVQSRHVVDSATEHKFDTDLGSLQKEDLGTPSVVDQGRGIENLPDYHVVLEMLKNPKSLRHAIILKEIFDRPRFD